jgi:hypothetical protein
MLDIQLEKCGLLEVLEKEALKKITKNKKNLILSITDVEEENVVVCTSKEIGLNSSALIILSIQSTNFGALISDSKFFEICSKFE